MSERQQGCPLCGGQPHGVYTLYGEGGGIRAASHVRCPTCGDFNVSEMLWRSMKSFTAEDRYRLSAITRAATERKETLELLTANAEDLLKTTPQPSPPEQMALLLTHLAARTAPGGQPASIDPEHDYPVAWAFGADGLRFFLNSMEKDDLIQRVDKSASPQYRITMAGYTQLELIERKRRTSPTTGWPRVDRGLEEARTRLEAARTEEQFQAIGVLCRETLTSLAQAVYDPAKHGALDGVDTSTADARRMLEAFIAAELGGGANEEARSHAKAAIKLTLALHHDRSAGFRDAAICVEATSFLISMVAIIAGKRDPSD